MTPRRMTFALIVTIIIGAAALLSRGSSSPLSDGPFLTADDFPSGYQVSRLSNTAPPGIGGRTTPLDCGPVIAEQASRQLRSATVGILATPTDETAPSFAQSFVTGGESVADTVDVIRRCPSYRQQTEFESYESTSSILSTPADCPSDTVVTRVRTQYGTSTDQSDTTSITAYVQGRISVGVLTASVDRPDSPIPDEFCRLTSRTADGLE